MCEISSVEPGSGIEPELGEPAGPFQTEVVQMPVTGVPSTQETLEIGGGESSDGEGEGDLDVDDNIAARPNARDVVGEALTDRSPSSAQGSHTIRHITKRTIISLQQKTVLEEFFRCGMTSASLQLHHLHQAAAEKTGLDLTVIKVHGNMLVNAS